MGKINVLDNEIRIYAIEDEDFISLTDIAKHRNPVAPADIVKNWLRNRNTIELLGLWERLNNPNFKLVEFDQFRQQAGLNSFVLSPKHWIEKTNAIGITSKSGRYGGTYAHRDIAFEFASWISVEFKLYLIKEFQRLKEYERKTLGWDIRRNLAKINYRIHTDAIQQHLIPPELNKQQTSHVYATEADVLNLALFGQTAAQWRSTNPGKKGNIRDYADVTQLVCLSNLENLNALYIAESIPQKERLERLNKIAIRQMTLLAEGRHFQLPPYKRGQDEKSL
ncbi:MAG: KilA-N domain-containing protein [FCB group bacterium]|nr:KilA-N domain-containing protein [FCB group bacterium]